MKAMLITGINGFLGSNLAKAFSKDFNIIGLEYGLSNLHRIKDCKYKLYDVRERIPESVFTEQNIDIIIHAATFYGRENESIKTIANANLFLPFDLLDQAINHGCKLFINTDTVLDRFTSIYALTKRHFQEWLFMRSKDIMCINMKLEHIYGPDAPDTNFITAMIKRLKNNEHEIDLTMGEQLRDFVYIDDVVSAFKTIIDNKVLILDSFREFDVATKHPITIKQLILFLKEITNSNTNLNFGRIPYRKDELMFSKSDPIELEKLNWKPKFNIRMGMTKTFNQLYGL